MLGTGLEHIDLIVLQDDLRLNHLETLGTEAIGEVVINIRAVMPLHQRIIWRGNGYSLDRNNWFFLAILAVAHALIYLSKHYAWRKRPGRTVHAMPTTTGLIRKAVKRP